MSLARMLPSGRGLARGMVMVLLSLAFPATAQVYKCVEKSGRTTYQQLPCPDAQKGTRMDMPRSNGNTQDDASDTEWSARAKRKEVIVGMPRAYVVQAYGTPQEMRPGRAEEKAVEVWQYRRSDLNIALGFNRGLVAWTNIDAPDTAAAAPDTEPSLRQNFTVSRKCADLAAEAGAPTSVYDELDEGTAKRVTRQVWEAAPGDRERTVVTCLDGTVTRVDRTPQP